MQAAASHLASCQVCSAAARQLENETTLLTTALGPEFDAVVPTEHLRRRIDEAIAGLPINQQGTRDTRTLFGWIQPFGSLFTFTPQRAFAYAALAVVVAFGVIFGIIRKQQQVPPMPLAHMKPAENPSPVVTAVDDSEKEQQTVTPEPVRTIVRNEPSTSKPRQQKPRIPGDNQAVAQVKLMPGERSYLKTIAALDSTIEASDRPMRSTLRAEYERNLAVVNRALAATRNAAKNNPNDPDAKEFMFDAYQSKVNLLNTVADARSFNRQQ
jgi:hypothetical protein